MIKKSDAIIGRFLVCVTISLSLAYFPGICFSQGSTLPAAVGLVKITDADLLKLKAGTLTLTPRGKPVILGGNELTKTFMPYSRILRPE